MYECPDKINFGYITFALALQAMDFVLNCTKK